MLISVLTNAGLALLLAGTLSLLKPLRWLEAIRKRAEADDRARSSTGKGPRPTP